MSLAMELVSTISKLRAFGVKSDMKKLHHTITIYHRIGKSNCIGIVGSQFEAQAQKVWDFGQRSAKTMNL